MCSGVHVSHCVKIPSLTPATVGVAIDRGALATKAAPEARVDTSVASAARTCVERDGRNGQNSSRSQEYLLVSFLFQTSCGQWQHQSRLGCFTVCRRTSGND